MSDCLCGHQPWWHNHDRFAGVVCLLCAVCGRTARHHSAGPGHDFKHCNCKGG